MIRETVSRKVLSKRQNYCRDLIWICIPEDKKYANVEDEVRKHVLNQTEAVDNELSQGWNVGKSYKRTSFASLL